MSTQSSASLASNKEIFYTIQDWIGLSNSVQVKNIKTALDKSKLGKIVEFVTSNFESLKTGSIGEHARSRKNIIKIKSGKYDVPYEFEFDTKSCRVYLGRLFLGEGVFKKVNRELFLPICENKAVSKQENDYEGRKKSSKKEYEIMTACKDIPHIVQCDETNQYYSEKKKTEIFSIVMHDYSMGSLDLWLTLNDSEKMDIFYQITLGLQSLHMKGIIHRDLKIANILLEKRKREDETEYNYAAITDFGTACWIEGDPDVNLEDIGTPLYMAPEIYRGNSATQDNDIWALGVLLKVLFRQTTPMHSATDEFDLKRIFIEMNDPIKNPMPKDEHSLDYIAAGLLQPDPSKRFTLVKTLELLEKIMGKK